MRTQRHTQTSFPTHMLVASIVLATAACGGTANQDTAADDPVAPTVSEVSDSERCEDALDATDRLSSAVDTMTSSNNSVWDSVELLMSSSLQSLSTALDGAEHPGLTTAVSHVSILDSRLSGMGTNPDYMSKLEFGRDALDLAIDVATHCVEVEAGAS